MNASSQDSAFDDDKSLREVLITDFNLTAANLEAIYQEMQRVNLSFPDAALHLGLMSPDQLAEARQRYGHRATTDTGLIETALRRISSDRRIVVRHGDKVKPGPELILAKDPNNPRSEKIRGLRTELLLLNEGTRGANIVPVVSAGAKEGRSQLAAELAISFAQLGRRTLLVDADLRQPRQHVLFGSTNDEGLARSLNLGERPMYHPVDGLPLMHLLTSATPPPNPLELLSDGRFEKLLSEWRNSYEFIVLDTPPISQCADGLAVASLAARVLLVSRSKHSSYKSTGDLLRRLATTRSTILGAVLNNF